MLKILFNKIKIILFLIKISKINILENGKFNKKNNYKKLQVFLKNKKIALVGNSPKLLNFKNNIDEYDVVIRINLLPLKKHYKFVGKRCDIMMMSSGPIKLIDENFIKIYFSTNKKYIVKYAKGETYVFPTKYYKILFNKIKSRPTTGMMALFFLIKLIRNPKITLFGFDHTPTSWYANEYRAKISSSKHDFLKEKKLFLYFSKKYKGINYSNKLKK